MTTAPLNRVIQHLLATRGPDGMTDGDLLTRFLSYREDDALAALVRRHGPMVWGVCRRLLHTHHDAEDAFQATFLVLVRKAAALPDREMVGNWLYGVARQTAVRMRAVAARRGVRERQVAAVPEPATAEEYVWSDLAPVLDEELSRLPGKYRALIVLCDLEGVTRTDVARRLGIPEGTAASRLAAARAMLAKRLARRGVALSGTLLGSVLSQPGAWAGVPAMAVASTIEAATLVAAGHAAAGALSPAVFTLTTGVMRAMFVTKVKTGLAVLLALGLLAGAAGLSVFGAPAAVAQQPKGISDTRRPEPVPPGKTTDRLAGDATDLLRRLEEGKVIQEFHAPLLREKNRAALMKSCATCHTVADGKGAAGADADDVKRLQGTWRFVSTVQGGAEKKYGRADESDLTVSGSTIRSRIQDGKGPGRPDVSYLRFRLNDRCNPKRIDTTILYTADALFDLAEFDGRLADADQRYEGIYEITGDTLRVCLRPANAGSGPPAAFESKAGSADVFHTLTRVPAALKKPAGGK